MDTIAEVLHHLVDNCQGFADKEASQAHQLITDHLGGDRHIFVPDPDNPDAGRTDETDQGQTDPRDAEIARLRADQAQRDAEIARLKADQAEQGNPEPDPGSVSEPIPVADQKAAGVPPDQTVTVADQKAGTPPPVLPE